MRKVAEGFVHRIGVHCESSAIRDVLEHRGLRLSEEMVFGLDCTFGFIYWKQKSAVPPFHIDGKSGKFPNTLSEFLGVNVERKTAPSQNTAWQSVKEKLDEDTSVPVFADIYYLDYMNVPKEPWNHFGAHMIVVAGYDEEKGEAYVADTGFSGLRAISLKSLAEARNSKHKPFPPRNTWFNIAVPAKTPPLGQAVKKAIKKTSRDMLNPPKRNFGVKGIRQLAGNILKWPRLLDPKQLRLTLLLAHVDMEEAGTGGGNFRRLYSRFLKEAGELTSDERLRKAGKNLESSADAWSEIARLLLKASRVENPEETISKAHEKIIECADTEEQAFSSILQALT
jgi:hypothetical protein